LFVSGPSYVEFCEWLDTAFTRPHLETTPTAPAPSWEPNESDPIYLSQAEADLLEVLLGRLANEVRVRGVVPKPVFADFDRTRRGTVSRNQFLQGLTFLSLRVGERETEVLCKRFGERHADGREDVRCAHGHWLFVQIVCLFCWILADCLIGFWLIA
jgi:hypothetical protein